MLPTVHATMPALAPETLRAIEQTLRLLAPGDHGGDGADAWRAAVWNVQRSLIDALDHPVAAYDRTGRFLHGNSRLAELLAGDREARLIQRAMEATAIAAARGGSDAAGTIRAVRTTTARYRLSANLARAAGAGGRESVLVTIDCAAPADRTDEELRTEFGLTRQEVIVARLMAEGLTNPDIAERLGVSYFTARNHAERVMRKLGVNRRTCVGPTLRGESGRAA
jgi:DNA-binding CsgD family transcriptional regulator